MAGLKEEQGNVFRANIAVSGDLVFVSDVHLHDESDPRSKTLIQLICACTKGQVSHFVLGGDIFEFYWARSRYFKKKFSYLWNSLEELSNSGTKVYFVQGNHEYCMEEKSFAGVKVFEADGTTLDVLSGGKTVKVGISHGDLLNAPSSYLKFKWVLNSNAFKFFFTLLPSKFADNFALGLARESRKKDKYRSLNHLAILSSAEQRLKREGEDSHIFGHFHYPYQAMSETHKELLCVPSWDLPNALVLKDGVFSRLRLSLDDGALKLKEKSIDFKALGSYKTEKDTLEANEGFS